MDWKGIKKQVTELGLKMLEEKISSLQKELEMLNESAASDTKSSMGDKYETGREMIQQERNKIHTQLGQLQNQKAALESIDLDKKITEVGQGALVVTDQMNYFLSTGLGEVKLEAKVFMLSAAAPVAQAMKNRTVGEEVQFNGTIFKIKAIV